MMLTQMMIRCFVFQGIKKIVLYRLNNVMYFQNMLCEATNHVGLLHLDSQKTLDTSVPKYSYD